jgi:uncharacterized protein YcfJ
MKNLIATASLASLLVLSSSAVLAKDYYKRDYDRHDYKERSYHEREHNHGHQEMARVIHVEPIYREVRISTPSRECYRDHDRYSQTNSYTSTIAGGLIGGVIGNQFGKGSGNTALTVAGTLLGGSIGHDMGNTSHVNRYDRDEYCHVDHRDHYEQQLDGYFVTYRFDGQKYTTRTDRHPGKYIPVTVSVAPLANYRHYH